VGEWQIAGRRWGVLGGGGVGRGVLQNGVTVAIAPAVVSNKKFLRFTRLR